MADAKGFETQLTFVEESTRGTTPSTPSTKILPFNTEDLGLDRPLLPSGRIINSRTLKTAREGNRAPGGSISSELDLESFGTLLRFALGSNTTTGTGPYTHTMKGADSLPAGGLSIEKQFLDIGRYVVFRGCLIDTLAINIPADGFITLDFGIRAMIHGSGTGTASGTAGTSSIDSSPSDIADTPVTHYEVDLLEEGGASIGNVVTLSIEIANNIQARYVIGKQDVAKLVEGKRAITGKIGVHFEDTALYDKFYNLTSSSIKVRAANGTNSLEIFLPDVVYHDKPLPAVGSNDPIDIELPFTARYDGTEATDIKMTLINDQAAI